MRANIFIDDEIMQRAIIVSGLKTKKKVIEKALYEFVASHSRKDLSDLKGQIRFADNYDYRLTREGRE